MELLLLSMQVQCATGAHSAQQRLSKPWTPFFTPPRKQGSSCAPLHCTETNSSSPPWISELAVTEFCLRHCRKLHTHKHTTICSRQGCVVFHQTLNQLSIRAILLWVTTCLQQNVARFSVQHCRAELTHLCWICSFSPAQRQGWGKWLISTSAITWLRYAQGMTHLKKSESNLQQTNYIVKSPSFSVLSECSPRILISLASSSSEMIWWVFFQKKNPLDFQTAHCTHSRLNLYCILSVLSQGLPAPLLSVQGLQMWEGVGTVKSLCFKSRICSLWIFLIKCFKKCYFGKHFSCNFIHKIFDRNLKRDVWNNFVLRLLKCRIAAGCMLIPFPQLSYHIHLCRNSNCHSNSHKRCSPQRITPSKEKYLGQWFSLSGLKCSS